MSVQKKVNIIMSTYNGEHFLVEQLDSLCNQTYENIDIYIRDDGSTDNTREILKKYIAENESSKRIIYVDDENGLRYPKCFIKLLLESEKADYYAFCDQDDVWNSDKIEKGVKELEKFENENNKPLLYYTAVDYYDEKLNFVRHSKFASHLIKDTQDLNLQDFLFGGEPLGMTYMFNNPVREALRKLYNQGDTEKKDIFIKIFSAATGHVIYNKEPSAKYRRHSGATTNDSNPSNLISRYFSMFKMLFLEKNTFDEMKDIINYINKEYSACMNEQERKLIALFSGKSGLKKRMQKVFWHGRFRMVFMEEIGYRMLFLIGRI